MILKVVTRRIAAVVGVSLLVAAVVTELRKPAGQRTWQGRVVGVVPYDFRLFGRSVTRADTDSVNSDELLVPRSFGVGWSVNVPAVVRRLRRAR